MVTLLTNNHVFYSHRKQELGAGKHEHVREV